MSNLEYQKSETITTKHNVEDLKKQMHYCNVYDIDAILEFLEDRELLNNQGLRVAKKFWETFIRG